MIKVIVGLGNPGKEYEKTRHNVGFLFLDRLISGFGGQWTSEIRFQALMSNFSVGRHKIVLLKPQSYMNKSGVVVGKFARYFKIESEEILIVHDELEFSEGIVKLKVGGGHGGHNGIRDIIAHLGSKSFVRLRVGIGRPEQGRSVSDYVLSKPSVNGMQSINDAFDAIEQVIDEIVEGDYASVMNKIH